MEFKNKARKAVIRFLQLRGYEILDDDFAGFVVCNDKGENRVAFVFIEASPDGSGFDDIEAFPEVEEDELRRNFETAMVAWALCMHGEVPEGDIKLDVVRLIKVSDDRAIIRHHINAM